mmetsp:Transcript_29873/g.93370  ORF Transcript_29873/g.93370 Transcript_29873/m.93370 type:complete len:198 (+) Transcript_29873:89-682(+)
MDLRVLDSCRALYEPAMRLPHTARTFRPLPERELDTRPVTAGVPLGQVSARGVLTSPLHPPTFQAFEYSRKRQAYGSVAPHSVPPVRHQPPMEAAEWEDEARRRWFKSFAAGRERNARSLVRRSGQERAFAGSGEHGHTEESPGGWSWQSWRGWTSTQRHGHEQRMRREWQDEARRRWQAKTPREEWKPSELRDWEL